ncbi:hypothetical protein [Vibrio crassostreae]|uniref:hypothetical protein n=1 Tax=Vibrio crassostreae TaxID=246167 RepID=UPI00104833D7|nr:hypothetical protein [Vibrio crassostreae]TCV22336.1 hypothetical protein EDB71_1162 [Vibrio crassostreae]
MNFSDMTDEKLINIIEQDKYRLSLAATMGAMQMCLFAKTAYLERILEDRNSYFVPKIIIPQPIQTNRNTTQYLQARLQNNLTQKQIREHGIHYIYAHSVGANIYWPFF